MNCVDFATTNRILRGMNWIDFAIAHRLQIVQDAEEQYVEPHCPLDCHVHLEEVAMRSRLIIEIGSYTGVSTRVFLKANPDVRVISIDPYENSIIGNNNCLPNVPMEQVKNQFLCNHREAIEARRLVLLNCRSAVGLSFVHCDLDFLPDAIYIDGGHTMDQLLHDLVAATALFPNAYIFGDDLDWSYPSKTTGDVKYHVLDSLDIFVEHNAHWNWEAINGRQWQLARDN